MVPEYANWEADQWYNAILSGKTALPFSFVYNGRRQEGLGELKELERRTFRHEEKEQSVIKYEFCDGVTITLELSHYFDFGVTEWTVRFENTSDKNTGVFEHLQTEITFDGSRPELKGILGDRINFYQPYNIDLIDNSITFSSDSGRTTHIYFPYFNIEYGDRGAMLAIGWAGTWSACFRSDGQKTVYTASAVNGLHTLLKPGESIRTALFVVAQYTVRSERCATNYWRRWFVKYNMPKADASGAELQPFSTCCLASDTGLPNSDGSISERYSTWKPSLEKMIGEDVKTDFRWVDAGWYIAPDGSSADATIPEKDWWATIGTWTLDPVKWPDDSFRQSTDFARANGMKTLLWFEPERLTDPENLAKNYGYNPEWAIRRPECGSISNNIGDPGCFRWTVDHICRTLRDNRVEMYREDNNSDSAALWKYLDAQEGANRHGITECKLIDAHYRLWDEIIACTKSYGGCGFVDSCAGGGGRNDIESLRRGIPLLRSDYDRTSIAMRLAMTTAFNRWVPFCGAINKEKLSQLDSKGTLDKYVWRGSYLPCLNVDSQFVQDPGQDFDMIRFGLREWKKVNPFLTRDFYVLTPWHSQYDNNDFTAYSFFDSQKERGVLLAFRQENCIRSSLGVALPYVAENAEYTVTDEDSGEVKTFSGKTLKCGMELIFPAPRSAKLLWIAQKE